MSDSYPPQNQHKPSGDATAWRNSDVYEILLEHFPAAAAVLDRDLRYLSTNRRWVEEFELESVSVIGRSHEEVFPDMHEDWKRLYKWCLQGHSQRCEDDLRIRSDGTADWVRWEIHPWRESNGEIGGLILTCSIIQDTRLSQGEAVADNGAEGLFSAFAGTFQEIAESAPFGILLLNDDTAEVLYANPQHRSLLGFGVEECGGLDGWLQRGCAGIGEPLQQATLEDWWELVWRRHGGCTLPMCSADGLIKEIEFRPAPLSGHRLLLTIVDVTDAALERRNLHLAEARYRALFQQASSAMIILNGAGHILEVNTLCENLIGCSRFEMRRAGLEAFLPAEALERVRKAMGDYVIFGAANPSPAPPLPIRLRPAKGDGVPVYFTITAISNEAGTSPLFVCSLQPLPPEGDAAVTVAVSPDLSLTLDAEGRVLSYCAGRDFKAFLEGQPDPSGVHFETVFPCFAELPLDTMRSHLESTDEQEVRCEFESLPLSVPGVRVLEARMIRLPSAAAEQPVFGLIIRDVTALSAVRKISPAQES